MSRRGKAGMGSLLVLHLAAVSQERKTFTRPPSQCHTIGHPSRQPDNFSWQGREAEEVWIRE